MDPFEQTFLRKDGTSVDVLIGLAVLDGPGEERVGFCLDITRRKQFEKVLQQSEEQLRKSQRMEAIGKLAGGIAHDFNNLLTAISGYTALAQAELEPGSRIQEYLGEVALSANRAAMLTSRLLAYGRKQFISPKIVDVNEVLDTMENALHRVLGEDIRLDFRLEPAVGITRVDPDQIEQVILNLAENAREAMPRGGTLVIGTSNREVDAYSPGLPMDIVPGAYIALTVSDTGTGIAPDVIGHIFEPFFTTKPMRRGGGLGLSMVEGIVKQNGGHIMVRSEPGKGSSFEIFLPKLASVLEPGNGRSVPSTLKPAANRRATVLVVEDEETVRRLVRLVLQANGYNVLEAFNGVAAERLARETDEVIHLLLTDAIMARMSGRELAESLRQSRPDMEVVFMSGYSDDAIVRHGVLDATAHFLRKPFSPQALLQMVREVLAARAPA
jgi:signal transduction histidine kinase/CheY-like chemotaxis protein